MRKLATLLLFALQSLVLLAGLKENHPYILLTSDSVSIHSIPYSRYGSIGITYINDLNGNYKDTILRYFNSLECEYSSNGKWIIEENLFEILFFHEGQGTKMYSSEELMPEAIDSLQSFMLPDGEFQDISSTGWILQSFIVKDFYYAVLANRKLIRTKLNSEKKETPIPLGSINFEQYKSLKKEAGTFSIVYPDFEMPDKDLVEGEFSITEKISREIHPQSNISFTVDFKNCKPMLLNYFESTQRSIYLIGSEPTIEETNPLEFDYYTAVKRIVEDETNWNCKLANDHWVFSYRVYKVE